jgi:DNA-binding NarL/FixJ family response regulator
LFARAFITQCLYLPLDQMGEILGQGFHIRTVTNPNSPIKVLCVDDSVDITKLVCMAISGEPDMEVVGEMHSAENLLEEVCRLGPDIVLLDLSIPGVDVLEALSGISEKSPSTRIVVFSGYDDQKNVDAAMAAGAWGYVSKNVDLDVLISGLRDVAQGEVVELR